MESLFGIKLTSLALLFEDSESCWLEKEWDFLVLYTQELAD